MTARAARQTPLLPPPQHFLLRSGDTVRPPRLDESGPRKRTAPNLRLAEEATRLVGTVIAGRYRITGVLGRGASSIVTTANDAHVGTDVALKLLQPRLGDDQLRRRFQREVVAMRSVGHPALVRMLDAGALENGDYFLAMELVRGRTLRDAMRAGDVGSLRDAVQLLRPIASALDHGLHAAGLVHRDVKPENIVVGERGHAKLIDLGIAFAFDDAEDRITGNGNVVGSPRYVAPEVPRGGLPAPAWDVYALAVILFEVLAGDAPFRGRALDVIRQKMVEPAPSVASVAGRLCPLPIELVMRRALDRAPANRPPTATALFDEVVAALDAARNAT